LADRHTTALSILDGASNPFGVANALVSAFKEILEEKGSMKDDAAARLIAHQLANIMRVNATDENFGQIYQECLEQANAPETVPAN